MGEINRYTHNVDGDGLNPDEVFHEEKSAELLETSVDEIKGDEFGIEKIQDFIEASVYLNQMEEVDPNALSAGDKRIVFEIDNKHYAYNQKTYNEGAQKDREFDDLQALLDLEGKLLLMEMKERRLKEIAATSNITAAQKDDILKSITPEEVAHALELEKEREEKSKRDEQDIRNEIDAHRPDVMEVLKKEMAEVAEGYSGKKIEVKIADIQGVEDKQEVIRLIAPLINKMEVDNPDDEGMKASLEELRRHAQAKKYSLDQIKESAVELIIQKEVANRGEEVPMTFGSAGDLLRNEFSEEKLKQNLSDTDLKAYYTDRFITHKELFENQNKLRLLPLLEPEPEDENREEREALMNGYIDKAKANVVERMRDVDPADWNSKIQYGEIRKFLLKGDGASCHDIAPYLSQEQFTALYESVYINTANRPYFDREGNPLGEEGKDILKSFREEALYIAKSNENKAIREKAEKEFNGGAFGRSVNTSMDECLKVMDEDDMPESWGERMKLRFLGGEEGRKILERYDKASNEYERISKFKGNYLNRKGEYIANINEFERTIRDEVGENLLDENLSQRKRRQLRKAAFKVRTQRRTLNEKLKTGLGSLKDCTYLEKAYKGNGCVSFPDFVNDGIIREEGWTPPTVMGGKEADKKYGTSNDKEQDKFLEGKDYEDLREIAFEYNRKEVIKELKGDLRKNLERDIASGVVKLSGVGLNRINREVDAVWETYWPLHAGEIEEKVNQRTEEHIKKLKDGFLDVNADGLMKFAIEAGYKGQILRKELHNEIFGDKGERSISATKIINLLEGQRINDLMLHEGDRRFELELERFCGKERWRQRMEGLDRIVSGNSTFKKDEYRGLKSALEEGLSLRSSIYQSSVKTKAYTYDMFGGISTGWNVTKRTGYQVINFVAPNSEKTRQKIDDTNQNISKRYANKQFRWENILNFGMPVDFPRARA